MPNIFSLVAECSGFLNHSFNNTLSSFRPERIKAVTKAQGKASKSKF